MHMITAISSYLCLQKKWNFKWR